jgi:tRNA threonylcarbamoyladenosine biosynthesis protein TsaB
MNILAVDTSTSAMNIAVVTDKEKTSYHHTGKMEHSENLMPRIIELTEKAGLNLKDYDLLVCPKGPGSFTGLRIAMSCLKGISVATDTPLVVVDTNLVFATQVSYFDGIVVPVIDAKKRRFYTSLFKNGNRLTKDLDTSEDEIITLLKDEKRVLFTGPDASIFYEKLLAKDIKVKLPNLQAFVDKSNCDFALQLSELGVEEFNKSGAAEMGIGPNYIRKSDAEVSLENKIREMNQTSTN